MAAEILEDVYLHIGNGGVQFQVHRDNKGRCLLKVGASHFGQKTNTMELLVTPDSLRQIGEAFVRASQQEFPGKPYVYSAEVPVYTGSGNAESSTGGDEPKQEPQQLTV